MSFTLAMTLLVRDEIDIVRANIDFHLSLGVDLIVATDNGSVDGTRDVLWEYKKLGVLHLLDESRKDFSQNKWVTRMALFAREELGATWILNNDADEFWFPLSGDLKTELRGLPGDLHLCRRRNMMFGYDSQPSSWRESLIYRVSQPLPSPKLSEPLNSELSHPYLYYDLPGKTFCRMRGLVAVDQGNHSAHYPWDTTPTLSENVYIYHFPVRNQEQFARKIEQGGTAYASNSELPEAYGWHWRRWYAMLKKGEFESAFHEVLPSTERIRRDLEVGDLIEDRVMFTAPDRLPETTD